MQPLWFRFGSVRFGFLHRTRNTSQGSRETDDSRTTTLSAIEKAETGGFYTFIENRSYSTFDNLKHCHAVIFLR